MRPFVLPSVMPRPPRPLPSRQRRSHPSPPLTQPSLILTAGAPLMASPPLTAWCLRASTSRSSPRPTQPTGPGRWLTSSISFEPLRPQVTASALNEGSNGTLFFTTCSSARVAVVVGVATASSTHASPSGVSVGMVSYSRLGRLTAHLHGCVAAVGVSVVRPVPL